jgi:hypothetical protein
MNIEKLGPLGIFSWFSDDWIVSPVARRLFLVSTLLVVAITPFFLGYVDISRMSFWERFPWGILFLVGPLGMFFLWLGMWRYWVRIDDSPPRQKRLWFIILLVGFWWGSCVYFYCVYLRQQSTSQEVQT